MKWFYFRFLYRRLMMLAHKNNWHHMTVSVSPDYGLMFRCHWCGLDRIFPPGRMNEDALRNHKIVL